MPASRLANLPDFAQLYKGGVDLEFRRVLALAGVGSDDLLAEIIEADGRCRLSRKLAVTLSRYLDAVPDLLQQPDALDAAIDVALRSLAGGSRITAAAVRTLS